MTPPTEAQEQTLDPIERLRLVAAMGGAVTLDPDTIRSLIEMYNRGLRFHEDADAAYHKSIDHLNRSMVNAAISIVLCLASLAVLLWGIS